MYRKGPDPAGGGVVWYATGEVSGLDGEEGKREGRERGPREGSRLTRQITSTTDKRLANLHLVRVFPVRSDIADDKSATRQTVEGGTGPQLVRST